MSTSDEALRREAPAPSGVEHVATVIYTNYRGKTSVRRIIPKSVRYGSTDWHPDPQWLLLAWDDDKQADREFALKDFGSRHDAGGGVREALDREESYLQSHFNHEVGGVMPSDIEGSFHRLREAALSTPSDAVNESAEAIELAYGLLWVVGSDRSTLVGTALYFARKSLLEQLDRAGQGRGISAARKVLNDEEAGFGDIRYSVSGRVSPYMDDRTGIRPGHTSTCDAASGDVAVIRNDGNPEGTARSDGLSAEARMREVLEPKLAAAERMADGITAFLAKPDWQPSRAYIEQPRNVIRNMVRHVRKALSAGGDEAKECCGLPDVVEGPNGPVVQCCGRVSVGDEAKESAPVRAPSLPSGESDLSVTTGCAGAGTPSDPPDRREIDQPHDWIKSTLGHGEVMCSRCCITNREAAVLGRLNVCSRPAALDGGADA